ncbi:fatty acid oxidation complex subunit alpha FadB [Burkholderia vietnamiensis]|uniref:enoyl-CoA hydratase n=1 Tax=Burkholderia vietnamiensis TaxID=60552 RepID=A0AAW7SZC1_BURVI|nr:fatty acid oxidation complex subunit alpha FadB [Burkholderia vietnamiensis]MBH9645855.1 fatty acid oxidation complex subunit alpha FadB [Burkholderia vietnamiensis]MBR8008836.1 fatty acid oxidation complex subunit alpha FadB [Burkholderia vietnamiensis]MDN7551305.1 fatty acid oxidation complex subunit alpha FadB [Burkholderia vietnamiensis]MDN7795119.1 fatty acid oxidation complex subunit alpha FadB [Burkholderia vietnamiensis]MDN8044973.1 fatty acid oxidation complex subunit alpha FadB [B
MFQGQCIQLIPLTNGFVELCFDRQGESINKLDARAIHEFCESVRILSNAQDLRGVLMTSSKEVFIVGADITEFVETFKKSPGAIFEEILSKNDLFSAFEDLGVPTVAAINGFALGGGLEVALTCSLRVMSERAKVGLPEVKLGLIPGFGGTVRMARTVGPATAIEWICSGKPVDASSALAAGVVDEVVAPHALREHALAMLAAAARGEHDWAARQERKRRPVALATDALDSVVESARLKVKAQSPKHQPASAVYLDMMHAACREPRDIAIRLEVEAFSRVAKTQAASSLVQCFLNEQTIKKIAKAQAATAAQVRNGAVVGAGIMGGGIAYTSALNGVAVRMKDISDAQLNLGISEAKKQLNKLVKSGRKSEETAAAILKSIMPQLDDTGFDEVDVVIEAVVERLGVKHAVLTALERAVRSDAVIASNTSSLRIDDIAAPLARPENFVGMHFFNPVPVMPLVEVIRGSRTAPETVATAVGYCLAMGKTPIVVKDCPGFLVNRVLTAYMRGFLEIVSAGADFAEVDRVMEAFGWPMGPAYLEDVVGMDTGSHVSDVISAGYAERMPRIEHDALRLMVAHQRFGQKNGVGFYRYETDPNGKPRRAVADDTHKLLAQIQPHGTRRFGEDEIIDRLMIPLVLEAVRALEEGVVGTPAELDMALLLGIGFPAYLGGALKFADWLGAAELVVRADRLAALGPMYQPTERLRDMARAGATFYHS